MRLLLRVALFFAIAAGRVSAQIPGTTLTPLTVPSGVSFWHIAAAADGGLWVSDIGNVKRLGRIAADGTFTGYPLTGFGVNPLPYSLTLGPEGNIWFTVAEKTLDGSPAGGAIGRMTPSGTMTAFPVPTGNAFNNAFNLPIAQGPDGNLWFLEESSGKVAKITTSGAITEYPIPTSSALPQGLASGSDGNMWFTEYFGKIGRVTPSGTITEFPVGGGLFLSGICSGPDGNLWFTANASTGSKIGRITPQGAITIFPVSTASRAIAGIATGQDGNLYFAESNAAKIGRLVPATGAVSESAEPLGRQPAELVAATGNFGIGFLSGSSVKMAFAAAQLTPTSFDYGLGILAIAGTAPCPPPAAPGPVSFGAPSQYPNSPYRCDVVWGASGATPGDTFEVQISGDAGFADNPPASHTPNQYYEVERSVPNPFYTRVRTVRRCPDGTTVTGPWSVTAVYNPSGRSTAPHLSVGVLSAADGSSVSVAVQDTGDASTNVHATLDAKLGQRMVLGFEKTFLDAGQSLTIRAAPLPATPPGLYTGIVDLSADAGFAVHAPLSLTVTPTLIAPGSMPGRFVASPADGAAGFLLRDDKARLLAMRGDGTLSGGAFVAATADPGGFFLDLSAVPSRVGDPVTFPLSADLTRLGPTEGCCLRTYVNFTPVGGIADPLLQGQVPVFLVRSILVATGNDRPSGANVTDVKPSRTAEAAAPPSGTSIVIPTAVNASNQAFNVTYRSDAWIRNESVADASATLYYTPDGVNGLVGTTVLKTSIPLPGTTTTLLPDLVGTIFGQTGSGQIEIRSASAPFLTVRSTTEATTGGDPSKRFGTEVPAVRWGSGVTLGGSEAVIPGVSDDAANRTNLILAETSGSAATVAVTVYDASGSAIGSVSPNPAVPPYGKIQLNRLVSLVAPGSTLSGGWASVRVTAGSGTVTPVATVLDNASNSFSAVRGRLTASGAGLAPAFASSVIVPSLARLTGAFNTFFVSSLRLVNAGSASANLTLTYFYNDRTSGQARSAVRTLTLPPRGALAKALGDDVLGSLFGLTAETYGWIRITGDVANLAAVAAVSAQVDNADPLKGLKTSQVDGVIFSAPEVMALLDEPRRFMGVESSNVKRTNLILVETAGQAGTALVEIQDRLGYTLGQKSVPIAANQYLQINNVVGDVGGPIGQGTLLDSIVRVSVTAGGARVVSFVTVNDNVSRNPEIFLLRPPGPPSPIGAY